MILRIFMLILIGFVGACASPPEFQPLVQTPEGVQFTLRRPDANTVAVAGTFNGWSSTEHPMVRSSRGVWSAVIPLSSGEYLFMYVVNGEEWVKPPFADDFVDDGFGQINGVVVVR